MNQIKYHISNEALKDLERIRVYPIKKWSKEQADRYFDLIINEIVYIASNFNSGKRVGLTKKEYRVTRVKSHLIFYKKNNDVVEIIRILHQRMDIKKRLD